MLPALMHGHAQVMKRERMFRLAFERTSVRALGSIDVATLVREEPLLRERPSRLRIRCGGSGAPYGRSRRRSRRRWRSRGCSAQRTMALLVALAAAARTRVVAPDHRAARKTRFGAREQRTRFGIVGPRRETPLRQRGRRVPLG